MINYMSGLLIELFFLIKITYQVDIIGFYQTFNPSNGAYIWNRCHSNCYTCIQGADGDNQNCISCDPKKSRYLLEGDELKNCYTEEELTSFLDPPKAFFLDIKQTPNKWVLCHENCKTCYNKPSLSSDLTTVIQMNCLECKDDYIKVNTFCYPKDPDDNNIGFQVEGGIKYCGQYLDDETGQQLGIFNNSDKCVIKPESYYFPQNDEKKILRKCGDKCLACRGVEGNDDKSECIKCKENYVQVESNCECPIYLGVEISTNNCVNCKYSPEGPYNFNGSCISSKIISGKTYKIINTTYNIISNCERPCLTCDDNGRCETCAPNYFLNAIAFNNESYNNNQICLTFKECSLIGILPDVNFSQCIFCDISKNEYKIVNREGCHIITDTSRYYYFIDEAHPALGECHFRCATCYKWPKGDYYQNCETCNDPLNYEINTETTNCDEIVKEEEEEEIEEEEEEIITCDGLFYFDIDAIEENEENEESNYNNKIKCINGSDLCPDEYQYLDQRNMVCVKNYSYSIIYDIRGYKEYIKDVEYSYPNDDNEKYQKIVCKNIIQLSHNLSYLEDYWTLLDGKMIEGDTSCHYMRRLDVSDVDNAIYNEDSTFQLTNTKTQKDRIPWEARDLKNNYFLYNHKANYISNSYNFPIKDKYSTYRNQRRVSILYLSECEKIIKLLNETNQDLLILKLDIYQNVSSDAITTNKVVYRIYNPSILPREPFDLSICKNYPINIITPVSYSKSKNSESNKLYQKLLHIKKAEHEPFIVYSDFYTKICNQYESIYGTDMNMKDRKTFIYDKIKNYNFCQKNCYYHSTDEEINFINCICIPQNFNENEGSTFDISNGAFTTLEENNEDHYKNAYQNKLLDEINKSKVNDYFNFYLMKCIKLLFTYDGFFYNYVSMIIIGLYILYLILIFFYSCIGFDFYINVLKEMLFHKFLYREYWRIIKKEEINSEEANDISLEEDLKEREIDIIKKRKIQNRTNTRNVFERVKKYNPKDDNKWIRINKSSVLIDPVKDDQIQQVNEYAYKDKYIYKNKSNKIRDYQNDININNMNNNAPPKRFDNKNNNFYHMEKNNDLINARTVKPITSKNYDDIQALVKGKQKSEKPIEETNENNTIDDKIDKELKKKENEDKENNGIIEEKEEKDEQEGVTDIINHYNKKTELHNTSPAIYIYNLILGDFPSIMTVEEQEIQEKSNLITKREYSFLNDGEINELDYDNSVFHDKRKFIRLYYSFLKYNCLLIFTFFVYEDFNLNFVKYALLINYAMIYLTFNTAFFNNNSIHNIYMNEGDYLFSYHWWKILLAFILSLIFIKLIKWWITFYRRKSLSMKLLKRYTDAKNEILRMIEQYHFHLKIYFPISCALFIFFWYYISVILAVFRRSFWHLLINWGLCALLHLAYSIILNFIPAILRYVAIKKEIKCLYKTSRIISYFF